MLRICSPPPPMLCFVISQILGDTWPTLSTVFLSLAPGDGKERTLETRLTTRHLSFFRTLSFIWRLRSGVDEQEVHQMHLHRFSTLHSRRCRTIAIKKATMLCLKLIHRSWHCMWINSRTMQDNCQRILGFSEYSHQETFAALSLLQSPFCLPVGFEEGGK